MAIEATPKFGKNRILMFRELSKAGQATAAKLALQTEHTIEKTRNNTITQTKDGPVNSGGGLETSVSISAVCSDDDLNRMLKESVDKGAKLELWSIDLASQNAQGQYEAEYMQGSLLSWSVPSNVEGLETLTTSFAVDGNPQHGYVTLTDDQIEEINYSFRDVTPYAEDAESNENTTGE